MFIGWSDSSKEKTVTSEHQENFSVISEYGYRKTVLGGMWRYEESYGNPALVTCSIIPGSADQKSDLHSDGNQTTKTPLLFSYKSAHLVMGALSPFVSWDIYMCVLKYVNIKYQSNLNVLYFRGHSGWN